MPPPSGKRKPPAFLTEIVPIKSLTPHPRNYRRHPPDQIAHIVRSIEQFGHYRNVVVSRDDVILAGHGVVEATASMGRDTVPVHRVDVLSTDPLALKVVAGDNEIGKLADVDDRALTEMLKEIRTLDVAELLGTGFDDQQLAALAMITRHQAEIADATAAAEWSGMPEYDGPDTPFKMVVSFKSAEDRDALMRTLGVAATSHREGKTWSIWWPPRPLSDPSSVAFKGAKK